MYQNEIHKEENPDDSDDSECMMIKYDQDINQYLFPLRKLQAIFDNFSFKQIQELHFRVTNYQCMK